MRRIIFTLGSVYIKCSTRITRVGAVGSRKTEKSNRKQGAAGSKRGYRKTESASKSKEQQRT